MKPVFLVILFILVFSQLMGKSFLHEANKLFVVECQDEKQGTDEISLTDTIDGGNEFLVVEKSGLSVLEKVGPVYLKEIWFENVFNTSFWRPPQNNSLFGFCFLCNSFI